MAEGKGKTVAVPGSELSQEPEKVDVRPGSEQIQLPSRGFRYEGRLPDGNVMVAPMTTREEALLVSVQGDRMALLNRVLDVCLLTREVPLTEFLSGDRLFLLLSVRRITYGSSYHVQFPCPTCHGAMALSLEIPKDLSVRALTAEDEEPFEVKLPVSGHTLGLRLLRVSDEEAVLRQVSRKAPAHAGPNLAYLYTMARYIVTADGQEVDGTKALALVENLVGKDSLAIRQTIETHDCGPDFMIETTCGLCSTQIREVLPLTVEFFRPKPESSYR